MKPQKTLIRLVMTIHILLYRMTGGRVGSSIQGLPVLLLTTTGRKSGTPRTVALSYINDDPNYVITGSNAGLNRHPGWFWNLLSQPRATIEVKGVKKAVVAQQVGPEQKQRLWEQLLAIAPSYGEYQKRTARDIPMVILRPAD